MNLYEHEGGLCLTFLPMVSQSSQQHLSTFPSLTGDFPFLYIELFWFPVSFGTLYFGSLIYLFICAPESNYFH